MEREGEEEGAAADYSKSFVIHSAWRRRYKVHFEQIGYSSQSQSAEA